MKTKTLILIAFFLIGLRIMNELLLRKSIFDINNINKAIKSFKDICSVSIKETEEYFVCLFSDCVYDTCITVSEFENYIIDSINDG